MILNIITVSLRHENIQVHRSGDPAFKRGRNRVPVGRVTTVGCNPFQAQFLV